MSLKLHTLRQEQWIPRPLVRYHLPFGVLGRLVDTLKVRDDVRNIFRYRKQRIEELFRACPRS